MSSSSTEPLAPARGVPRSVVRTLCSAQLVSAIGDGSFYVTSALFFSQVLGLTATQIGLALTVAWGVGFVLTAPIGQLGDRFGLRESAAVLSFVTAIALVLFAVAPSTVVFVAVTALYAVAQSGSGAVRQALLVRLVTPGRRVVVRARLQSIVNGGIGAGAGIGGAALYASDRAAYLAVFGFDAATFVCAAALLLRLPAVPPSAPAAADHAPVLRDRPYVLAAGLNAILYLYMPMLSVVLPLYTAHRTGAPGWAVAALFVLNTFGVLLLQLPAARAVTGLLGAAASVRRGGWALLAACLAFWAASVPASPVLACVALVAGIALQVLGEVWLAAGSWEIGFGLADPDRPGQWQGLYSSAIPVARALGPLALTALVLGWSGPGWLVLGGILLAASLAITPVVRWAMRPCVGVREVSARPEPASRSGR